MARLDEVVQSIAIRALAYPHGGKGSVNMVLSASKQALSFIDQMYRIEMQLHAKGE